MKNLGKLFGADLLLDTNDEKIFRWAEAYFKDMKTEKEQLAQMRIDKEMAEFEREYKPSFWKIFFNKLF